MRNERFTHMSSRAMDPLCRKCSTPIVPPHDEQSGLQRHFLASGLHLACYAEIIRLATDAGLPKPIIALENVGGQAPKGATVGTVWYDTQGEQLLVCVDQQAGRRRWAKLKHASNFNWNVLPEAPIEPLTMWVVYKNPSDFDRRGGDIYVLRRWQVSTTAVPDERPTCYDSDLEAVRAKIPAGLVRMDGAPGDDPAILETWF